MQREREKRERSWTKDLRRLVGAEDQLIFVPASATGFREQAGLDRLIVVDDELWEQRDQRSVFEPNPIEPVQWKLQEEWRHGTNAVDEVGLRRFAALKNYFGHGPAWAFGILPDGEPCVMEASGGGERSSVNAVPFDRWLAQFVHNTITSSKR